MNRNISEPNQTVPPRFDAEASANAQPVEPIPPRRFSSRISNISEKFRRLSRRAVGQVEVLVAVVVVGLVTGALAGMLLVKAAKSNQAPVDVQASTEQISEIPPAEVNSLDAFATQLSERNSQPAASNQPRRARRGTSGRPRAYRVAVIR